MKLNLSVKVGDRKLVKVQMTKKADADLPMFKIMSDVDLEVCDGDVACKFKAFDFRLLREKLGSRLNQNIWEVKSSMVNKRAMGVL